MKKKPIIHYKKRKMDWTACGLRILDDWWWGRHYGSTRTANITRVPDEVTCKNCLRTKYYRFYNI